LKASFRMNFDYLNAIYDISVTKNPGGGGNANSTAYGVRSQLKSPSQIARETKKAALKAPSTPLHLRFSSMQAKETLERDKQALV